MQLQVKPAKSFRQRSLIPHCVFFVLETYDKVVRVTHDDYIATRAGPTRPVRPQDKHMVQIADWTSAGVATVVSRAITNSKA